MFKKQVASKEAVKLMLALTGPSGAGKTYSALQLAYGITSDWTKITLADTENKSALYYAGDKTGAWEHIDFPPTIPGGYHPNNWIKLIEFVESDPKTEVLILDSISHEWSKAGGALDINNKLGGRFADWAKVTPLHDSFVDKIRNSRLHIIATMRVKTDYSMEQNEKGKTAPIKVGLKPEQREGVDYEFGVIFDVGMSHMAQASKDRTGLFSGRGPFQITPAVGKELLAWSKDGKEKPTVFYDDKIEGHRKRLKNVLMDTYGKILVDGLDEPNISNEDKTVLIDFIADKDLLEHKIEDLVVSFKNQKVNPLEGIF